MTKKTLTKAQKEFFDLFEQLSGEPFKGDALQGIVNKFIGMRRFNIFKVGYDLLGAEYEKDTPFVQGVKIAIEHYPVGHGESLSASLIDREEAKPRCESGLTNPEESKTIDLCFALPRIDKYITDHFVSQMKVIQEDLASIAQGQAEGEDSVFKRIFPRQIEEVGCGEAKLKISSAGFLLSAIFMYLKEKTEISDIDRDKLGSLWDKSYYTERELIEAERSDARKLLQQETAEKYRAAPRVPREEKPLVVPQQKFQLPTALVTLNKHLKGLQDNETLGVRATKWTEEIVPQIEAVIMGLQAGDELGKILTSRQMIRDLLLTCGAVNGKTLEGSCKAQILPLAPYTLGSKETVASKLQQLDPQGKAAAIVEMLQHGQAVGAAR